MVDYDARYVLSPVADFYRCVPGLNCLALAGYPVYFLSMQSEVMSD